MIKDIAVNLGLSAHDPAGDFAISVADAFAAPVLGGVTCGILEQMTVPALMSH